MSKFLEVKTNKGEIIRVKKEFKVPNPQTLEGRLVIVRDLFKAWLRLKDAPLHRYERGTTERLLAYFIKLDYSDFLDEEDLKQKVSEWLERTEEYFKRKFERELKERCLSRFKRKVQGAVEVKVSEKKTNRIIESFGTPDN